MYVDVFRIALTKSALQLLMEVLFTYHILLDRFLLPFFSFSVLFIHECKMNLLRKNYFTIQVLIHEKDSVLFWLKLGGY